MVGPARVSGPRPAQGGPATRPIVTQTDRKIRLGGVKFSAPLALFNLTATNAGRSGPADLARLFNDNCINMACLAFGQSADSGEVVFCVPEDESPRAQQVLALAGWGDSFDLRPRVGTISLFPTRFSLQALGLSFSAMAEAGLPVYATFSSVSQLVHCTDFYRLDDAAAALAGRFELPANHTPLRPQFRVTQYPWTRDE